MSKFNKLGWASFLFSLVLSQNVVAADFHFERGKSPSGANQDVFPSINVSKLIVMPMESGHSDWVTAIKAAKKSLHMEMYHVTDKEVIDALISRAHDGLDLRVLIDHKATGGYKKAMQTLIDGGVQVRPASSAFSITHTKTMVIDDKEAWVTSINMTNTGTNSRDFGIVTPDKGIISEINDVFETDWNQAEANGGDTPALSNPNLAWAPVNATEQITKLIGLATKTLDVEVENIGLDDVINALNAAAARGVQVRLIIPACTGNNTNNYAALGKTSGVKLHVEQDGKSIEQPYLHAKMIVADGKVNYIGSINYSYNSMVKSRELGVIFTDSNIGSTLSEEFTTDWNRSDAVEAGDKPNCSSSGGGDSAEFEPAPHQRAS